MLCGTVGRDPLPQGPRHHGRGAARRARTSWGRPPQGHARCVQAGNRCAPQAHSSARRWSKWTHWDLNPGPSACEADVIPLHHVPLAAIGSVTTLRVSACRLVFVAALSLGLRRPWPLGAARHLRADMARPSTPATHARRHGANARAGHLCVKDVIHLARIELATFSV